MTDDDRSEGSEIKARDCVRLGRPRIPRERHRTAAFVVRFNREELAKVETAYFGGEPRQFAVWLRERILEDL